MDGEGHELAAAFGDAAMNVKKFISFGKRPLKPSQKLSKERPFHSFLGILHRPVNEPPRPRKRIRWGVNLPYVLGEAGDVLPHMAIESREITV